MCPYSTIKGPISIFRTLDAHGVVCTSVEKNSQLTTKGDERKSIRNSNKNTRCATLSSYFYLFIFCEALFIIKSIHGGLSKCLYICTRSKIPQQGLISWSLDILKANCIRWKWKPVHTVIFTFNCLFWEQTPLPVISNLNDLSILVQIFIVQLVCSISDPLSSVDSISQWYWKYFPFHVKNDVDSQLAEKAKCRISTETYFFSNIFLKLWDVSSMPFQCFM